MRKTGSKLFVFLLIINFSGCNNEPHPDGTDDSDGNSEISATINLYKIANSDDTRIRIVFSGDQEVDIEKANLTISEGTSTKLTITGSKTYESVFEPAQLSTEHTLTFSYENILLSKVFLTLKSKHSRWGVVEAVPGMVNTLGWEDSSEISPDGNWLFVSTYSPICLLCCIQGNSLNSIWGAQFCTGVSSDNDPNSEACNITRGPFNETNRPDMLGGDRIISDVEINHEAPLLGIGSGPYAIPPVAAYGFKKQADGSFAQPFVIGMDWDGFTWGAPFGFTFWQYNASQSTAKVIFAFNDLAIPGSSVDLYSNDFNLGSQTIMGNYAQSGAPAETIVSNFTPEKLQLVDDSGQQGNPSFDGTTLFWDEEGGSEDLWFATLIAFDQNPSFTPRTKHPLSKPGRAEFQPFKHKKRLYFNTDHKAIISSVYLGGAVSDTASWGEEVPELAADQSALSRIDGVGGVGEPSLAIDDDGVTWMYFIYTARRSFGLDLNVGRVRRGSRVRDNR